MTTTFQTQAPTAAAMTAAGRWDLYGPVHKGLRLAHSQMLQRLGAADFSRDCVALIADLRTHLVLGAMHLEHEEDHIHGALRARLPTGSTQLDAEHDHHRERFVALEGAIRAVEAAQGPAAQKALGRALYLLFTHFVAEDFAHMAYEEEVVWPQMCELFSDSELMGIEMAIVGSIPPEGTMAFMRFMIPAINPAERADLLGGMKANAPPQAYAAVFEHAARPTLTAADLAELAALDLAA